MPAQRNHDEFEDSPHTSKATFCISDDGDESEKIPRAKRAKTATYGGREDLQVLDSEDTDTPDVRAGQSRAGTDANTLGSLPSQPASEITTFSVFFIT